MELDEKNQVCLGCWHEHNLVQILNLGALKYSVVKQLWVVSTLE